MLNTKLNSTKYKYINSTKMVRIIQHKFPKSMNVLFLRFEIAYNLSFNMHPLIVCESILVKN